MTLPVPRDLPAMEARLVGEIPEGEGWQYEPKWDGFRCIAFRDGEEVRLQSKSGQPLARYFPEMVAAILRVRAERFVLDGELLVPVDGRPSFDALLQRVHPARSRIERLSGETPAILVAFDLLVDGDGEALVRHPLAERRPRLERFLRERLPRGSPVFLSPATTSLAIVRRWFGEVGEGLDGVIAKRLDLEYRGPERSGMVKVKNMRTADCVVGGFRYASSGRVVGSLLLGLYDAGGLLHHVGFTSGIAAAERKRLAPILRKLFKPPGFTGQAPGGPSRWSTRRSSEWEPLEPRLVVEVRYDHFTGGRFRHGTSLLRWRPDKAPRQCTLAQVEQEGRTPLLLLDGAPSGASRAKGTSRKAVRTKASTPAKRAGKRPGRREAGARIGRERAATKPKASGRSAKKSAVKRKAKRKSAARRRR